MHKRMDIPKGCVKGREVTDFFCVNSASIESYKDVGVMVSYVKDLDKICCLPKRKEGKCVNYIEIRHFYSSMKNEKGEQNIFRKHKLVRFELKEIDKFIKGLQNMREHLLTEIKEDL